MRLKLPLTPEQEREVAEAARRGAIIIFPTDTVYGIGSGDPNAAARIYEIKGRPENKPLPVLHASKESAKQGVDWTPLAERLSAHWPGALTLVLRRGAGTVGVRVPNHPALQRLLEAGPWISTSANLSGQPASRTVVTLPGVDYVLDGGETGGVESTVVDATGEAPVILRQGAIKL